MFALQLQSEIMDFVFKQRASAYCNGDFILLETKSGYRSVKTDPEAPRRMLAMDAEAVVIGRAVLDTLQRSRQIDPSDIDVFFDPTTTSVEYDRRNEELMERFGYKSKKALFKNMASVSICRDGGQILLSPLKHDDLEGWGRKKGDGIEDVLVAADVAPAELGAALRLAFSRCK